MALGFCKYPHSIVEPEVWRCVLLVRRSGQVKGIHPPTASAVACVTLHWWNAPTSSLLALASEIRPLSRNKTPSRISRTNTNTILTLPSNLITGRSPRKGMYIYMCDHIGICVHKCHKYVFVNPLFGDTNRIFVTRTLKPKPDLYFELQKWLF